MNLKRTVVDVEPADSMIYETWGEIARALGVSIRSAQRYARRRGLKVAFGPANRVWAEHGWIRAWKAENVTTVAAKNGYGVD